WSLGRRVNYRSSTEPLRSNRRKPEPVRALTFDTSLHLVTSAPLPVLEGDQALLKVRKAGICRTDLELIGGYKGFSGILGHEFVAEVVQGPDQFLGRRVVGEINVACG